MSKLMIVLLAVGLVCVSAYVKRDTAESTPVADAAAQFEAIKKQLEDLTKTVADELAKAGGQAANAIDPEAIKKNVNDLIDNVTKSLENLKPAAAGDAKPAAA